MKNGMLWFDPSADALEKKVSRAAAYYQNKHGRAPDTCLVHPRCIAPGDPELVDGVKICAASYMQLQHLLIGVESPPTNG